MKFPFGFALLFALAVTSATSASAQQNKPIRSGTFYEDRAYANANGGLGLDVMFAQAPTDKYLNITNVSCEIQTGAAQTLSFARLQIGTTSGANDVGRVFTIGGGLVRSALTPSGSYAIQSLNNASVQIKVGPGRFPTISIFVTSASTKYLDATCVIVGDLSDN